tara:strand:- start:972 stop:1379 length:408 start_codon:yes stop_codon:yes gene_type:complete
MKMKNSTKFYIGIAIVFLAVLVYGFFSGEYKESYSIHPGRDGCYKENVDEEQCRQIKDFRKDKEMAFGTQNVKLISRGIQRYSFTSRACCMNNKALDRFFHKSHGKNVSYVIKSSGVDITSEHPNQIIVADRRVF